MTVADQYPARTDDNGTTWYRAGPGGQDGWTSQLQYADPSYRQTPTETEETHMPKTSPTALTEDGDEYTPPRFTTWMRYPLPPAPPRPVSEFNGWGQYKLPAPETGRPAGFPRATTIAKTLDDITGLEKWKRRETALRVFSLAQMDAAEVVYTDPTGDTTAGDLLGVLTDAMAGEKVTVVDNALDLIDNALGGADARELGECAHAWLEALDTGLVLMRDVPDVVRPHVTHARRVLCHRGLVPVPDYVERVVMNDRGPETVAGKIDRIYRMVTTGELVLGDVKTSKKLEYSWLPFGVQVGGVYGWATKMLALDGKTWEPMPEIRQDFAVLLHVPSDQPERAAAITIDLWWGGEVMAESLQTRQRRREAKVEVPKHAIPAPSDHALRYAQAWHAITEITTAEEGQAVYETYEDVWDDALGEFGGTVAELL